MYFITARAQSTREGNYRPHSNDAEGTIFTGVCLSTSKGGTPSPSNNTSSGPYQEDTAVPVGGTPGLGYCPARTGLTYSLTGTGLRCTPPGDERTGDKTGVPPTPSDRTAE